ncbi:MAG: segregation/condensation protein A [Chromatiales bacterium]|nr:segregation/condensation protein A [Chromatiales bacterium]
MSESAPEQTEMPFAVVSGEAWTTLPKDLYIPPDALEVFLETFSGPLDLLLYLIKRQNLDILDIPIAEITRQYMDYVELMKDMKLELAAEYMVMAAMLAEIKSRMLLPRPPNAGEDEDDPRAELVRRLQEYERFRQAAEDLDVLPQLGRDVFPVGAEYPHPRRERPPPAPQLTELLLAFADVVRRAELFEHHHVRREPLSVRERMVRILSLLPEDGVVQLADLIDPTEGRLGVVVSFLAVLELVKESLLKIVQNEPYGPIHLFVHGGPAQEESDVES